MKPITLSPESSFELAVKTFREGGVIAFPTETFYGLCVDPFNPGAVKKLFELKGRPEKNPVALILPDEKSLPLITPEIPSSAKKLIKRFWPGPLTIIFNALPAIPPLLIANTGKAGARVSPHPVASRLAKELGSPITATSANPSGKKPPSTPQEVIEYFNGSIDVLIDGGKLEAKKGSTIVDATDRELMLVREGEIPFEDVVRAGRE